MKIKCHLKRNLRLDAKFDMPQSHQWWYCLSRLRPTKDNFYSKHAISMSMSDWLDIRIMCSSVATWLPVNCCFSGRVWRYQRGNQDPYIEEQTTQWSKEKAEKDKQRSTKYTYKTDDRVTRTALKTGEGSSGAPEG